MRDALIFAELGSLGLQLYLEPPGDKPVRLVSAVPRMLAVVDAHLAEKVISARGKETLTFW